LIVFRIFHESRTIITKINPHPPRKKDPGPAAAPLPACAPAQIPRLNTTKLKLRIDNLLVSFSNNSSGLMRAFRSVYDPKWRFRSTNYEY
jgi:hypothetical protein